MCTEQSIRSGTANHQKRMRPEAERQSIRMRNAYVSFIVDVVLGLWRLHARINTDHGRRLIVIFGNRLL